MSYPLDNTDLYFFRTQQTLQKSGLNPTVTYVAFLRTPCVAIHKFVNEYIQCHLSSSQYLLKWLAAEGEVVPANRPLFELSGKMQDLVMHETPILMRIGFPSVCAYNARQIRNAVGTLPLIDMSARHCPGEQAVEMAAYAAHIGGFTDTSTILGASTFRGTAVGTMPHALVGAYETTAAATEAFHRAFPQVPVTALVDYHGQEITDAIHCCKVLKHQLYAIRLDTHKGRYCEGTTNLEQEGRMAALLRMQQEFGLTPYTLHTVEEDHVIGKGVTVEAVYRVRKALDEVGATNVKIVVSSGFNLQKVKTFMACKAPIDAIGTGSFLPSKLSDTFATMDIVEYDGKERIKVGREHLLRSQRDVLLDI